MSGQFRRIQDLEEDVKYRFSIGGVKIRHPSPRIRQLMNIGWQEVRTIVSLASDSSFLVGGAVTALPTTAAVAGDVYAEVDFPLDAVSVYGVRVQRTSSSRWYPLKRMPWAAYHDFQYRGIWDSYSSGRFPRAYCAREIQKGVEDVETPGKVMIVPIPQGGNYRLWYMQAWTPQVEDNDILSGHESWFEFLIYATMIRMLGPDADSKKQYPMWAAERQGARNLIEARANRLEDGMALEPRDARMDGEDPDGWGAEL